MEQPWGSKLDYALSWLSLLYPVSVVRPSYFPRQSRLVSIFVDQHQASLSCNINVCCAKLDVVPRKISWVADYFIRQPQRLPPAVTQHGTRKWSYRILTAAWDPAQSHIEEVAIVYSSGEPNKHFRIKAEAKRAGTGMCRLTHIFRSKSIATSDSYSTLISIKLFHGGTSNWPFHLNAAANTVLALPSLQQPPNSSVDRCSPFLSSSFDQTAVRLFTSCVIWYDCMSCVSLGRPSQITPHYEHLLLGSNSRIRLQHWSVSN